jgi:hypothetical protein
LLQRKNKIVLLRGFMSEIISPVINGYVYYLDDDNRYDLLNEYAKLVGYSHDWQKFISTDKTNYPEYWADAIAQAKQVYESVNTIWSGVLDGSMPFNQSVALTLSPPGNTFEMANTSTGDSVSVASTGVVWNLWAMGLAATLNDSNPAGIDLTQVNLNNIWNNTFAKNPPSTSTFEELLKDSATYDDPPAPSPATDGIEWTNYILGMTTVQLVTENGTYRPKGAVQSTNFNIPGTTADSYTMDISETNSDYRNFLVQAIYDFRNLGSGPLSDAVESITGAFSYNNGSSTISFDAAQILVRPAIQDMLYFDYALTGEGQLQRQLGTTTDQMRVSEDVLTALNLLEKTISADIGVDRFLKPATNSDTTQLWSYVSAFTSGYSMLKKLYNNGSIQNSERQSMIASVLKLASDAVIAVTPHLGAAPDITADWYKTYVNWWSGNKASNTNNNAITQWENQNNTLQQDLKQAVFIYQEFVKSASTLLRKLNQLVRATAQQIKGS